LASNRLRFFTRISTGNLLQSKRSSRFQNNAGTVSGSRGSKTTQRGLLGQGLTFQISQPIFFKRSDRNRTIPKTPAQFSRPPGRGCWATWYQGFGISKFRLMGADHVSLLENIIGLWKTRLVLGAKHKLLKTFLRGTLVGVLYTLIFDTKIFKLVIQRVINRRT
jgi:hypothetical protein